MRNPLGTLFGIGIGLTTATQLRPIEALPVGPGEIVLAGWAVLALIGLILRGRIAVDGPVRAIAIFWAIGFAALSIGWIAGLTARHSDLLMVRDLVAFALSATVFLLALTAPRADDRLEAAQVAFMFTVLLPCLLFLLLTAMGRLTLGPIAPWYYDIRFEGWSTNPNQMALAMLPIPFWALRALAKRPMHRWPYVGCLGLSLVVGVLTRSDALWLAWFLAGSIALSVWLVRRMTSGRWRRWQATVIFVVVPLIALAVAGSVGGKILDKGSDALAEDYNERGQGPDRFRRWGHALQALDESPVVGWGPGSFSGPNMVYEGEEAHNTLLDWAASTGVFGLVALLGILGYASLRSLQRRDGPAFLLLITVGVFFSFHYVARQPMFWLVLLGIVVGTFRPPSTSIRLQESV